jgi:ankyrin repeat protein
MKTLQTVKCAFAAALVAAGTQRLAADSNAVTDALQRGLVAEEVNHDLNAAIAAYEEAVRLSSEQRAAQAAALFHLADCQRRLGQTARANENFRKVVGEYPDQKRFAELAAAAGGGGGNIDGSPDAKAAPENPPPGDLRELRIRHKALEQQIPELEAAVSRGQKFNERLINGDLNFRLSALQNEPHSPVIEKLQTELVEARVRDASLSATYGPDHPERKANMNTLKSITEQLQEATTQAVESLRLKLEVQVDQLSRLRDERAFVEKAITQIEQYSNEAAKRSEQSRAAKSEAGVPADDAEAERKELAEMERMAAESPDQLRGELLTQKVKAVRIASVKFLLAHGVPPDEAANDSETPLVWAVKRGSLAIAKVLVDAGADPNRQVKYGALHAAAESGHLAIAEYLLAHGANPNSVSPMGRSTPLLRAIDHRAIHVATALLTKGADPNLAGGADSGSPLLHAVLLRQPDMIALLLQSGANPNLGGDYGDPPAALAPPLPAGGFAVSLPGSPPPDGEHLHTQAIRHLLARWNTPLGVAAERGDAETVKALLAAGALPDYTNPAGFTALHRAVAAGAESTCKLLLAAGANPNARDLWDRSPMLFESSPAAHKHLVDAGGTNYEANPSKFPGSKGDKWVHVFGAVEARVLFDGDAPLRVDDLVNQASPGPRADKLRARILEASEQDLSRANLNVESQNKLAVGRPSFLLQVEVPGTLK